MNGTVAAGAVLAGLGIAAEVLHGWLRHVFVSLFFVGKGQLLDGGESFSVARRTPNRQR